MTSALAGVPPRTPPAGRGVVAPHGDALEARAAALASAYGLDRHLRMVARVERLSVAHVVEALAELGCPLRAGGTVSVASLAATR